MSDKERLQEIKESWVSEAYLVKIDREHFDWLIEQAEKVERYEKARQSYLQACDELEGHADIVRSIISELRAALEGTK